jgi:hypothetical protein
VNNSSIRVVDECLALVNIVGHARHDCHRSRRGGGRVESGAVWFDGSRGGVENGQLQVDRDRRSTIGGGICHSSIGGGGVDRDKVDLSPDIVGGIEDESRVGVCTVRGRKDERSDSLSIGRVGHGTGDINVSWCSAHTHVSLPVVDDGHIVIVTAAISAVSVSTAVVTVMTVMFIVVVRSLVKWCELFISLHLASVNDGDSISMVTRLEVDGSTVSVTVTVLVDNGIGVVSVVINDVDPVRVSLVVVTVVTINNDGITVSASLDDGGIVSVTSSLDNGSIVVVSGDKERLDLLHDRLSLVNGDRVVVSMMMTIHNNHVLVSVTIMRPLFHDISSLIVSELFHKG